MAPTTEEPPGPGSARIGASLLGALPGIEPYRPTGTVRKAFSFWTSPSAAYGFVLGVEEGVVARPPFRDSILRLVT